MAATEYCVFFSLRKLGDTLQYLDKKMMVNKQGRKATYNATFSSLPNVLSMSYQCSSKSVKLCRIDSFV